MKIKFIFSGKLKDLKQAIEKAIEQEMIIKNDNHIPHID